LVGPAGLRSSISLASCDRCRCSVTSFHSLRKRSSQRTARAEALSGLCLFRGQRHMVNVRAHSPCAAVHGINTTLIALRRAPPSAGPSDPASVAPGSAPLRSDTCGFATSARYARWKRMLRMRLPARCVPACTHCAMYTWHAHIVHDVCMHEEGTPSTRSGRWCTRLFAHYMRKQEGTPSARSARQIWPRGYPLCTPYKFARHVRGG